MSIAPTSRRGFALVVTLIMVALLAIIAVGVLTSVSLERATATSYTNRYQAELAVQNGLQAAAKTLAATPTGTSSITGTDTFLVVRADGTADANGNRPAYYYLTKPSAAPAPPSITYYPLFSASSDPSAPAIQTQTINLTAQDAPNPQDPTKPFAPLVPAPVPPANSTPNSTPTPTPSPGCTTCNPAWNAAKSQRLPTLYPWTQPSPGPSGPTVQWIEMHDPQDQSGPYTRYAYWAEDLDGYLDASQVGGLARTSGTNPQEIAMFTVFDPTQQTDPGTTAASSLINNRSLLFTVPTVQQIAATTPDLAGPNLAVRLGIDTAEQNLVPLGYGYGSEGQPKTNLNPLSNLHGNIPAKFAAPVSTAMPGFANRSATSSGGHGHSGTVNYLNNLAANIVDYASPQNAPTEFMPNGNQNPPSARGIGAYPLVTSVYDLNNWVFTHGSNATFTYHVVVEVKTYIQLWNPHNVPVTGALTVHYDNSDQVNLVDPATGVNRTFTLTSPADATVIFEDTDTDPVNPDPNQPVITSPLTETGNVGVLFNYQIAATNSPNQYRRMKPNEYRVIVLPAPASSCSASGNPSYNATGLPPSLTVKRNGGNAGLISGTPTTVGTYSVTISETTSCGTATATLVITINP